MTRNRFVLVVVAALTLIVSGVSVWKVEGTRDVVHAEAADDPHELSWAPPDLTDPLTVVVGDDPIVNLDDDRDYHVVFPDTPVRHRVTIDGGRNVVIIGGEIDIPWQGDGARIYQRRGLLIRGQTGTIHIEGLLITGEDLSEGINIDAPDAIVQLQNIRVEHVHARDQVNFSDNHPDVIQPWGGVAELRIDRLTGQTDYQGIFLKEDFGAIGPVTLRRVHIEGDPTARYLYWDNDNHVVTIDRTYVSPAPGRSLEKTLWPNVAAWPGIVVGAPPSGEFVPPGLAGIGYQAWPYAGDVGQPPPANSAPTVIASAPSTVELGSAVAISGTVIDDGLPGPYTVQWSQTSGPGVVSFGAPTDQNTTASFSTSGVYGLTLTADDGELSGASEVTIVVTDPLPPPPPPPPVNEPPTVTAWAPSSAEVDATVILGGTVSDDGMPGPYTVRWRQVAGPMPAALGDVATTETAATFGAVGVYELELTADDGELSGSSSVTVTVTEPPPDEPVQVTESFSGTLNKKWPTRTFETSVAAGNVDAALTISNARRKKSSSEELTLVVYDASGNEVGRSRGSDNIRLATTLAAGVYTWEVTGPKVSFTLEVRHMR